MFLCDASGEDSPLRSSPNRPYCIKGSKKKVVFEEGPQQPTLWEVWTEGPRSCGKTVFWFFHSSGTFHNAFACPIFIYAAGGAGKPKKAPQVSAWGKDLVPQLHFEGAK